MRHPIVIRPRPILYRSVWNEWELHIAWQRFSPDEIEDGFVKYLQDLDGWRSKYTRRRLANWIVVDIFLSPDSDADVVADILETLQGTAKHEWRWSRPNQLPQSLLLPLYLKHKSDAIMVKLKHG